MDLTYTPQDVAFREHVRKWLRDNLPVTLKNLEDRRAWHRKLYDAGFVGMGWPKEYGGQAARPLEEAIVAEEMALANAPGTINNLGIGFIGPTLIFHGTEAQKQRYVKKILTAEEIWCQLYSEPGSGSDLASLRTTAVRDGDHWIVNGSKVWSSGAYMADWAILLARTDPTAPKHLGISYFILDMHSPGVEVRPLKQMTGSSEFCQEFLTNVRVPHENMIGKEGEGWKLAQTTLGFERGGGTLSRVTAHRMAFSRLLDACGSLTKEGRPALEDPVTRHKLGQILTETEVLRYAGLRILAKLEKGEKPGSESSVDKLFYSELDKRHQEITQEILGPFGQVTAGAPDQLARGNAGNDESGNVGEPAQNNWAYPFMYAKAGTIFSGSSEIQKNIIGERVLKLPREPRMDRFPDPVQKAIKDADQRRGQRSEAGA